MRRGDIVIVALQGDLGKPRPALIVQSDIFNADHPTVLVLALTSELRPYPQFRITLDPSSSNGLREVSQVMIDKAATLRRERIGKVIGRLDDETMLRVNRALAVWIGLA